MLGPDAFPGEVSFGGLSFNFYRAVVTVLVGWALKHIDFASILVHAHPDLRFENQITLTADVDKFTEHMANALEVTTHEAQQGLAVVELNLRNTECCISGNTPPPLIRVSAQQYLKISSGMLMGPFLFMLRNLKLHYRSDWDHAVNSRESIFRQELYSLFPQQRLIKMGRNVELRKNGRKITDIDAAIIDPDNQAIGLFQLKWQDFFEGSMRERSAKLRNFLRESTEWISAVRTYIHGTPPLDIARMLNVSVDLTSRISVYRLFVIGRNFAHFSGNTQTDPQVAWGLWPQVLRLIRARYNFENPVVALHTDLRKESPFLKNLPTIEEERIKIGSYNVVIHPLEQ
jgi:hypothetical protein